jgi:hypothetical protein
LKKGSFWKCIAIANEVNWKGTAGAVVTKNILGRCAGSSGAVLGSWIVSNCGMLSALVDKNIDIRGRIGRYAAVA